MDFFTHFLLGVFISVFTLKSMPFSIVIYASVMTIIADLDLVLEPLRKIIKSNLLAHKGISHSIFYSALISILMGAIFSLLTKESFFLAWFIGFLFYDLHIFLDFLTASKIPLFFPISKRRFRFFIDRAINFPLALISGNIIILYIFLFFNWQEIFFSAFFYYLVGFYVVYFTFRIVIKILMTIKYPKPYKYIPGISPFSYLLYIQDETEQIIHYKLILKSIFNKNQKMILESKFIQNSHNKELYRKALNLIKKFPFGEKWDAIIPTVEELENVLIMNFFFAESYYKGSYYSIRLMFKRETNEILELNEGFNRRYHKP